VPLQQNQSQILEEVLSKLGSNQQILPVKVGVTES